MERMGFVGAGGGAPLTRADAVRIFIEVGVSDLQLELCPPPAGATIYGTRA